MNKIVRGNPGNNIEIKEAEDRYQLVLPCDVKDFRQFVSGLLGKPQEERGSVDGCFHAEPKDISNIFHLVNQRVTRQNEGSLIHFSVKVLYDNGTSVTHNTVEHFESYYPTSQTTPKEVVLSFTYLIKFQNKEVPEKQEIEVIISINEHRLHESDAWLSGGLFEYRINHTDRTWSSDIANVLKNHATTFMDKHSSLWKWIKRHDDEVFEYTFWIVLFGFSSYWYISTRETFFLQPRNELDVQRFLEHIVTFGYVGLSLIAFTKIIEKIAAYRFFIRKSSFITLVDKDYERMKKQRARDFRIMLAYIFAWFVNVSAGVVASYIYASTLS